MNQDQESYNESSLNSQDHQNSDILYVILIGAPKSGKSSIFTQLKVNSDKSSSNDVGFNVAQFNYEGQIFELIDTDGLEEYDKSNQFRIQQTKLYKTMNNKRAVGLFIVCKYDSFSEMKHNIGLCYFPFQSYKSIITLIITHMDLCDNEEKEKIPEKLKPFQVRRIIYTGIQSQSIQEDLQNIFKNPVTMIMELQQSQFNYKADKQILSSLQYFKQSEKNDQVSRNKIDKPKSQASGELLSCYCCQLM